MDDVDPTLFYTGIVAELYGPLRAHDPDPEPCARFIEWSGEPALELGCGDGDPLLELRRRGLDVTGLDSSPDMVERCRERAAAMGLSVVLFTQPMESMTLPQAYRSIFLAGPTFNLLPDDDLVRRALGRILAHLAPEGRALVPLFVPTPTPRTMFGTATEQVRDDGRKLRCGPIAEERDEGRRRQTTVMRYEIVSGAETTVTERPWVLHWHTQDGFRALAEETGFAVVAVLDAHGEPAAPTDELFAFVLARRS
jgi:SAM-dependent methyltransferase